MRLSIIIYSGDPATIWNAFRMANFDRHSDDEAKVFLLGAGVEAELLEGQAISSFPNRWKASPAQVGNRGLDLAGRGENRGDSGRAIL